MLVTSFPIFYLLLFNLSSLSIDAFFISSNSCVHFIPFLSCIFKFSSLYLFKIYSFTLLNLSSPSTSLLSYLFFQINFLLLPFHLLFHSLNMSTTKEKGQRVYFFDFFLFNLLVDIYITCIAFLFFF